MGKGEKRISACQGLCLQRSMRDTICSTQPTEHAYSDSSLPSVAHEGNGKGKGETSKSNSGTVLQQTMPAAVWGGQGVHCTRMPPPFSVPPLATGSYWQSLLLPLANDAEGEGKEEPPFSNSSYCQLSPDPVLFASGPTGGPMPVRNSLCMLHVPASWNLENPYVAGARKRT